MFGGICEIQQEDIEEDYFGIEFSIYLILPENWGEMMINTVQITDGFMATPVIPFKKEAEYHECRIFISKNNLGSSIYLIGVDQRKGKSYISILSIKDLLNKESYEILFSLCKTDLSNYIDYISSKIPLNNDSKVQIMRKYRKLSILNILQEKIQHFGKNRILYDECNDLFITLNGSESISNEVSSLSVHLMKTIDSFSNIDKSLCIIETVFCRKCFCLQTIKIPVDNIKKEDFVIVFLLKSHKKNEYFGILPIPEIDFTAPNIIFFNKIQKKSELTPLKGLKYQKTKYQINVVVELLSHTGISPMNLEKWHQSRKQRSNVQTQLLWYIKMFFGNNTDWNAINDIIVDSKTDPCFFDILYFQINEITYFISDDQFMSIENPHNIIIALWLKQNIGIINQKFEFIMNKLKNKSISLNELGIGIGRNLNSPILKEYNDFIKCLSQENTCYLLSGLKTIYNPKLPEYLSNPFIHYPNVVLQFVDQIVASRLMANESKTPLLYSLFSIPHESLNEGLLKAFKIIRILFLNYIDSLDLNRFQLMNGTEWICLALENNSIDQKTLKNGLLSILTSLIRKFSKTYESLSLILLERIIDTLFKHLIGKEFIEIMSIIFNEKNTLLAFWNWKSMYLTIRSIISYTLEYPLMNNQQLDFFLKILNEDNIKFSSLKNTTYIFVQVFKEMFHDEIKYDTIFAIIQFLKENCNETDFNFISSCIQQIILSHENNDILSLWKSPNFLDYSFEDSEYKFHHHGKNMIQCIFSSNSSYFFRGYLKKLQSETPINNDIRLSDLLSMVS